MNIILIGAPGAGKGTQAARLSRIYHLPHIATGDLFRAHMAQNTALGNKARDFMEQGVLVPDSLTVDMVDARLSEEDAAHGVILDGFPRNLPQAELFEQLLRRRGWHLDSAVYIAVPVEILVERLSGRRVCPKCGATYHVLTHPPKNDNRCDVCGTALITRPDDAPDTVRRRLAVYTEQTAPLIAYYQAQNLLRSVDGAQPVDEVTRQIQEVLAGGTI
ncbi:MAG: adenylate kinase [Firmicutes bacterium]|nr:adenylate kinase [Bacillota bacterium]